MKKLLLVIIVLLLPISALLWLMTGTCDGKNLSKSFSLHPIPECRMLPTEGWNNLRYGSSQPEPQFGVFARYISEDHPQAIKHAPLPKHPLMSHYGNNMHNDAYVSDVNAGPGPTGINTEVLSRTQGFGGYGTITFDKHGRLIAVGGDARKFQLEIMDPHTLIETHRYNLPPRSIYFPLQGVMPWKYIGAGMYFYLDNYNRAIVPTTRNTIMVVQTPEPDSKAGFTLEREYDLSNHVVKLPWPKLDSVAWVLPEWPKESIGKDQGRYWYATIEGMVGTVEMDSGKVNTLKLENEIIENSFALGEEGIFIMSDKALYRLNQNTDEQIYWDWRTEYDFGPAPKPGHITRGSGSSVTLAGSPETGVVIITDNAEPKVHLELFLRSNGKKICSEPLFIEGKSGTDLTTLAFQHADNNGNPIEHYSVMIENNWGHHSFPVPDAHKGITRVDAIRQSNGSFICTTVWESDEKGIAGAKLSLQSGLLYMYIYDEAPARGWYFAALDFKSGKTVFRQHTGTGHGFNAWQGVLFLHPFNGTLYSTTIFGIVAIRDAQ